VIALYDDFNAFEFLHFRFKVLNLTHKRFFFCDFQEGALTAKQLIQRIEDSLKVKP